MSQAGRYFLGTASELDVGQDLAANAFPDLSEIGDFSQDATQLLPGSGSGSPGSSSANIEGTSGVSDPDEIAAFGLAKVISVLEDVLSALTDFGASDEALEALEEAISKISAALDQNQAANDAFVFKTDFGQDADTARADVIDAFEFQDDVFADFVVGHADQHSGPDVLSIADDALPQHVLTAFNQDDFRFF